MLHKINTFIVDLNHACRSMDRFIDNWFYWLTWIYSHLFSLHVFRWTRFRTEKVNYPHWQLNWVEPEFFFKKQRGGIILLLCDFHSPPCSRKWQDALRFCLRIHISEHYTWNAPVTLNIGSMLTTLLSSSVIWHQVMCNESWKTSASTSPLPPSPSPYGISKRTAERMLDTLWNQKEETEHIQEMWWRLV